MKKIFLNEINNHEIYKIDFDSKLEDYINLNHPIIKKVISSKGLISINNESNIYSLKIKIKFRLNVVSSLTNIPFDLDYTLNDNIQITNVEEFEVGDVLYFKNEIDIEHIVYSLLLTSLPISLYPKNEKNIKIEGVRVIKEDEYYIEKDNKEYKNNFFDKLEGLEFDDK